MLKMEDFFMIRDLHHQGVNISQISQKIGLHRNTVRKHITAQTSPVLSKRGQQVSILDPFKEYIQQRINEYPLCATETKCPIPIVLCGCLNSLLNIYFIISYGLVTQIMSLAFQKYPLWLAIFLRSAIPFGLS